MNTKNGAIHERQIQTDYYRDEELVKTNYAKYANSAVLRCVDHMQLNSYGATVAEVHDNRISKLHAVVTHNVVGEVHIVYKQPVVEGQ